jgi:hypothetical protein
LRNDAGQIVGSVNMLVEIAADAGSHLIVTLLPKLILAFAQTDLRKLSVLKSVELPATYKACCAAPIALTRRLASESTARASSLHVSCRADSSTARTPAS